MVESSIEDLLVLNGVDPVSGDYFTPPVPLAALAAALRGETSFASGELRRRRQGDEAHLGVSYEVGPRADDLSRAGWGVVVPDGLDPAVLDAVQPLLALRQEQAGERYKVLTVAQDEEKDDFLARYRMGPSVADPRRVPYYLLLLGTPEQISFEFQYQLAVSYAVGRLDLACVEDYARYAASVVADELRSTRRHGAGAGWAGAGTAVGAVPPNGDASAGDSSSLGVAPQVPALRLFAPRHPGDKPTALSVSRLVQPLATDLGELTTGWTTSTDIGAAATKDRLLDLLTGDGAPDVLFTAGHGLGVSSAESPSRDLFGALLCDGWAGPLQHRGPLSPDHYLAADDVPSGARISPRIVLSFACFGAGTPRLADYPGDGAAAELADQSFTARLPQRLLGGTDDGALAFVGHVDRAWTCSFLWKGLTAQVTPFRSTLLALMDGARLGFAMESITSRYAELATELTHRLGRSRKYGVRISDADLVGLWTATHDARGYVVLGDPAVRVASPGAARLPGM